MRFSKPRHTTWRELGRRLWAEFQEDSISDCAAQLAFYFLFSLFPFLFFLVTLAAYMPFAPGAVDAMVARLAPLMPGEALQLVQGHLRSLVAESQPKLITLGLLVALWTASRGVDALRKALNLAYDVPEHRPYWKTQGLAILTTLAGTLLIPLAFALFLLGGRLGAFIAGHLHVLNAFHSVWTWLRWPLTAGLVMVVSSLCYWSLPAFKHRYQFFTPGALLATVLWLATTWGFTQYVEHFGRYNVTYGSIGGVVVLLLWLYLTGLLFIIGGEVNAVLEQAQAEADAREGRTAPPVPPALSPEAVHAAHGSGRQRLAFWRWRRRAAQEALPNPDRAPPLQREQEGNPSLH
jgi:membrane protein